MTEKNPHIRTDTSPEREAHLRVLADQGDNALRDALAMATEARTERDEARRERDSAWVLLKQAIRRESEEAGRLIDIALAWLNEGIYRGGSAKQHEMIDLLYEIHQKRTGETPAQARERWDREGR